MEARPVFLGEEICSESRGEGVESGGKAGPGASFLNARPEDVARRFARKGVFRCGQEKKKKIGFVRFVDK